MFSLESYWESAGLPVDVQEGARRPEIFQADLSRHLNPANLNTVIGGNGTGGQHWFNFAAGNLHNTVSRVSHPRVQDNQGTAELQIASQDDLSLLHKVESSADGRFQDIVQEASRKHGVPVALINAVMKQESACNPQARSHAGAMGLMQLMPGTAKDYGCANAYDPYENVMAGTAFLSDLLKMYDGNVDLALAGYNAGPGNVKKYGNQIPPFRETQDYVTKVKGYYQTNLRMMDQQSNQFSV